MRSTGLTAEASANLSQTTFTIDKDNSLTLTPVPKPPANVRGYYDEPKFHKVEFAPAPERRPASVGGGTSVVTDVGTSVGAGVEASLEGTSEVLSPPPQPQPVVVEDGPKRTAAAATANANAIRHRYDVFVPKPRRTYDEHVPDVNVYVDPVVVAAGGGGHSSPCRFGTTNKTVVRDKSPPPPPKPLPVKALIDAFEHDDTPTMRYLRPDERVPLSPAIRHLHDDRPPSSLSSSVGYYLCDAAVETRSFTYVADCDAMAGDRREPVADVPESESECGGGGGDDTTAPSFHTTGHPATPDSLESSMLFAQKQTLCDARRREDGGRTVPGKTNGRRRLCLHVVSSFTRPFFVAHAHPARSFSYAYITTQAMYTFI